MATAGRLQWRRAAPRRALRRTAWSLVLVSAVAAAAWLVFGGEPVRLAGGQTNPLALIPPATTAIGAAAVVWQVSAAFRRPLLEASHYALRVRPGRWRTLVLPWAAVAEVAGLSTRGGAVLLIRCVPGRATPGDRPGLLDRSVLRSAMRTAGPDRATVAAFDLAVRMEEFAGTPEEQLASLAAWAPGHVRVTDVL
ncbi:MAG TPA: hypothetical protein VKY81_09305 [Natronosporangium sp.]|nr:hypothetical protein [Natronosporangium sp.]